MVRIVRAIAWVSVSAGIALALYGMFLLSEGIIGTPQAQASLAEEWEVSVDTPRERTSELVVDLRSDIPTEWERQPIERVDAPQEPASLADEDVSEEQEEQARPIDVGDAKFALWFERNGERIVSDEVLYVVEGTTQADLQYGPGHYIDSDMPGVGNLAMAGHRSTWGSPFAHIDRLQAGDTIHVLERDGTEWIYEMHSSGIVMPQDTWVIGDDPIGTGRPTLTLTTCHPRYSAAQRLIVWADISAVIPPPDAN